MKTDIRSSKNARLAWLKIPASFVALMMLMTLPSCQQSDSDFDMQGSVNMKNNAVPSEMSVYFGHKIFTRGTGTPYTETVAITNPSYDCYDNFILYIKNGDSKKTRVSSAEIRIDDILIARPSDFSKNVTLIKIPLSGLTPESILDVKLNSAPGSFIDLWIEGTLNIITPLFNPVGPLALDTQVGTLPTTSLNGVTGTWDPAMPNTSVTGFFSFTFTPDEGQCAVPVTMVIEITNKSRVEDIQGNRYATVKIGNQWWMAENLRTTVYKNGDLIGTTALPTTDIGSETEPKYQWAFYQYEDRVSTSGRLYTWYAATDARGVCPDGWHIADNTEWTTLIDYLTNNGYGFGGSGNDIAKSMAATYSWNSDATPGNIGNDLASNNSSGFKALPGGYRTFGGTFDGISSRATWWSSDQYSYWVMTYNASVVNTATTSTKNGFSVRCVKD